MERDGRFSELNLQQYRNKLSPFGQQVFTVLINNWNKEQYNNRYNNNTHNQRNWHKRKVITFDDSRASRSTTLSQKELLDDRLYYNSRQPNSENRDIIINDNDVGDVCNNARLHELNILQNNINKEIPNVSLAGLNCSNSLQNNYNEDNHNNISDELLDSAKKHAYENSARLPPCNVESNSINITVTDMLNPIENNNIEDNPSFCSIDLLRPLEFNNKVNVSKHYNESRNNSTDFFTFELSTPINGNRQPYDTRNDIPWSEMFDTELLPDMVTPAVKQKMIDMQNAVGNDKQFNITFPKVITEKQYVTSVPAHNTEPKKNKAKQVKNLKPVKRKNERTINEGSVPKKLKEVNKNAEERKMRKGKYTKTVKKWLDSVDPNNVVEDNDIQESKIQIGANNPAESNTKIERKILSRTLKDTLVRGEQKAPKKVIQAQLKNKGGVMKFSKPDDVQESTKDSPLSDTTMETVSKVMNKVNVKKTKPKFIAPLKSQVHVKEINFSIVAVDEVNWKECCKQCNTTKVYAAVLYSNGFCELNKQFTEDDCIPEGVMLLIDEEFYYFKKINDTLSNIVIQFFENQTIFCHDGKNILIFLKNHFEHEINFEMCDVKIGGSLLEPDNPPESFGDVQKLMSSSPQYTVATECPLQRTAWYLTLLRDCADKLKIMLTEQSLWSLFEDIEMKVLPIIAEMEFRGIQVNTEKLKSMEGLLLSRMRAVEAQCHGAAGRTFQIASPAQVAAILYDELQLHAKCNLIVKETGAKGAKSTSEAMLRTLVPLHPLPGLILEYRRLHKAHATFLAGIGQHVKDGVLKPIWVQTAAATGRVAASNPNVQAIPKTPFCLTSDADDAEQALNLRSVYVARAGHVLVAADFQQVECRVFAACAADTVLQRALRAPGDLFTLLAAQWLKKPACEVSAADRERTKRIVYARLYGAGVRRLMDILRVSIDQALIISASFDNTFPSLKGFGAGVVRASRAGRAPRTPAGRARALPALHSADPDQRAHAQRQAVNFLVQGTAADVCKVAMHSAQGRLRRAGLRARLLLQVHDELVWEVPREHRPAAQAIIKAAMESSGRLAGLPWLPVLLRAGPSWGELRPVHTADPPHHTTPQQ